MSVKLLTVHHLEFLSLNGGCRGSSESTLVKMSNCWKYHVAAHMFSTSSRNRRLNFSMFLLNDCLTVKLCVCVCVRVCVCVCVCVNAHV